MEEIFKFIGIFILTCFIITIIFKSLNLQLKFLSKTVKEGLTTASSSSSSSTNNGYAGNAFNFSDKIKALNTQITDKLIVSKYRTDYENIIINLEDYISLLMLDTIFTLNLDDTEDNIITKLNSLGSLKLSKDSLNDTMKYLDAMK